MYYGGFLGSTVVKNPPANTRNTGDVGSIPGSGRSSGGGNGNPLQYSFLGNPMDRGTWQGSTVHGATGIRHNLATKPPPPILKWLRIMDFNSTKHWNYLGVLIVPRTDVSCPDVTKQDPMVPPLDSFLPHVVRFSSSLKYIDDSIWSTLLELFYRC